MANAQHLAIFKEGVPTWNEWRTRAANVYPDLTGADLSGSILDGVIIGKADLGDAVLVRASLVNADLNGTELVGCDLTGADLRGASLLRAQIDKANLDDADFSNAILGGAFCIHAKFRHATLHRALIGGVDFSGADLTAANLSGAVANETIFAGSIFDNTILSGATFGGTFFSHVDLSGASGLETCRHLGPSSIDFQTLSRSGSLPLPFLRGCGLSDVMIDYLPSISASPVQFYSCFISYCSINKEFAERLHADLQNSGVRCWFAPENLKIGDPFRDRIDESIRVHEKLLLILSANSVESAWVQDEVEAALERERLESRLVLFPIMIDNAVMRTNHSWAASIRRTRHVGDFTEWKDHDSYLKAFSRLRRDLTTART
jgi:hypothetical protein